MNEHIHSAPAIHQARATAPPLTSEQLQQLNRMWEPLYTACHQRLIPGASAAVYWQGHTWHQAGGLAVDTAEQQIPVHTDTVYDCASLTKVAVTLPLILTLIQRGMIELDQPASAHLLELRSGPHRQITIRQLLSHTSGLPAIGDFHSSIRTIPEVIEEISQMPPAYTAGQARVYSDPGFMLLGELFTRITGLTLAEGAARSIFDPLQMKHSLFTPGKSKTAAIAATEYDTYTGTYLQGIVHDENARALGGICGHAGLFSTAGDLLRYAQYWLEAMTHTAPIIPLQLSKERSATVLSLSNQLVEEAISTQTPALPGIRRGLGWVLQGDETDVSGPCLSSTAFGHTGFTGTSIQIDPRQQLAIVLLTNRVHYGRQQSIQQLRRDFHTAVSKALSDLTDTG
ncbi:serine hydrolase domain-containing protein [Paenibacillus sp. Z6-24]